MGRAVWERLRVRPRSGPGIRGTDAATARISAHRRGASRRPSQRIRWAVGAQVSCADSRAGGSLGDFIQRRHAVGDYRIAIMIVSNVPLQEAAFSGGVAPSLSTGEWDTLRKVHASRAAPIGGTQSAEANRIGRFFLLVLQARLNRLRFKAGSTGSFPAHVRSASRESSMDFPRSGSRSTTLRTGSGGDTRTVPLSARFAHCFNGIRRAGPTEVHSYVAMRAHCVAVRSTSATIVRWSASLRIVNLHVAHSSPFSCCVGRSMTRQRSLRQTSLAGAPASSVQS